VPLIDWEEASAAVAGDEPDDAFLVELMATFYHECAMHVRAILRGVIAYRDGGARGFLDPEAVAHGREAGVELTEAKAVVRIVKDEAHAIKGSAANLRFWRLARVSVNVCGGDEAGGRGESRVRCALQPARPSACQSRRPATDVGGAGVVRQARVARDGGGARRRGGGDRLAGVGVPPAPHPGCRGGGRVRARRGVHGARHAQQGAPVGGGREGGFARTTRHALYATPPRAAPRSTPRWIWRRTWSPRCGSS
jgi:hypothetical protein